jgi:hypothetical protein
VGKVVAHDDQVPALFVLLVEVAHGPPVPAQDPKSSRPLRSPSDGVQAIFSA